MSSPVRASVLRFQLVVTLYLQELHGPSSLQAAFATRLRGAPGGGRRTMEV
ncbi:hypothetical protein [Streptomyces meridianus]|uniref:Uncharacterized protein n=1 Tax=Streptomyces meridianus TaxID=2938945 RepID=A0ABT0X5I4_9ACTN|nr:hypothetical protein [Streptomyces meridianus]MCM2577786.1 hypothetical protein [Streptomyces meridianus]